MTRVLHVIAELGVGGAEAVVVEMVRRGPTVGWSSIVASAGGDRVPSIESAGATHIGLPLIKRNPLAFGRAVARVRRTLSRSQTEVIVAHNVIATMVAAAACATLGRPVPVVAVFHGVKDQHYRFAARLLRGSADSVVAVSAALRQRLVRAGMDESSVKVIRNSITTPVEVNRDAARRTLGLAPDVPVALCVARLAPQKRHDVLIRAWSRVERPAVLLLAGDGGERPELQRLVQELDLGGRVQILGARADVPRLLAAADVSVLSSDWEGLPIAILESMSVGLPIVSTKVDGVAEVVTSDEGILVEPDDPGALAAALRAVLFDESRRRRLGEAARERVARQFDPQMMMTSYGSLCETLLAAAD